MEKRKEAIDQLNEAKTARTFIFMIGAFFLFISLFLLWVNPIVAVSALVVGLIVLGCAKFSSTAVINKIEKVLTGT